jgi:phosphatidylserine decarboxylase
LRHSPLAKEGLLFIVPAIILSLLFLVLNLYLPSLLFFFLFLFFCYFFRNPNRIDQSAAEEIIAAADGKVMGVEEMDEDEFLKGPAVRVATFMGLGDVHVNRAPCEAVVTRMIHKSGRYGLAFKNAVEKKNERHYILLEKKNGEKLLVVQIVGFLARRIHCWVREGDAIRKGDPIGIIAFGSRVDVYLPPGYEIMVKLGDKVKAGVTSIARTGLRL